MELEKIASNIEKAEIDTLNSHIDDLADALSTTEMVRKAKLPEAIFKEHFLPALRGDTENNSVGLMKYVEYAGSPYSEVDVINEFGETLYTCPPLYNRSKVEAQKDSVPFSDIAATYELKKARLPIEGTAYLNKVVDNLKEDVTIDKDVKDWGSIFNRYAVSDDDKKMMVNNPTVSEEELNDMIDYD